MPNNHRIRNILRLGTALAVLTSVSTVTNWQMIQKAMAESDKSAKQSLIKEALAARNASGVQAAELLARGAQAAKEFDDFDTAEQLYRQAWLTAEAALGIKNPRVERFAQEYAAYLLNDTAGRQDFYWAKGKEDFAASWFESARQWQEMADKRKSQAGTDASRIKIAEQTREDAANRKKIAEDALKEAAKSRAAGRKAIALASERDLWSRVSERIPTDFARYNSSPGDPMPDFVRLNLGHLIRTNATPADLSRAYTQCARLEFHKGNKFAAVEGFNDAIKFGARAWSSDSDEMTKLRGEFQRQFPVDRQPLLQNFRASAPRI